MISADEIIKLIKQGKKLQEIAKLVNEQYYELRTQGYEFQEMKELINDLIYELSKRELNETEIATIMNMSKEAIKYRLERKNENKEYKILQRRKEEDEKIYQLREQGLSQVKIAEIMKLSSATIQNRLRIIYSKKGREQPNRKKTIETKKLNKNDEINNKILEYLEEGLTKTEIGKKINLSPETISYRIKKMQEKGVIIKKRLRAKKLSDIDKSILNDLEKGMPQTEIARNLNISKQAVYQKVKKIEKYNSYELSKAIINLIKTRNATLEQIQIIADYYGVNLDKTFSLLDER